MQVSLITCTNNSEKTIKSCCQSIYSQSYDNIEHIVIDKNSHDQTIAIVKQYQNKNTKIYYQKGLGIYNALNEGMRLCNGNIVGILHSDDEFVDKDTISNIASKFIEKNLDILFSNVYYTEKKNTNNIIRDWKSNFIEGIQSNNFLNKKITNGWMPPHPSIFFKKDILSKIGYFDENFKISSDYDFIIRLFKEKDVRIFFLNKYTIKMRIGGVSNKNINNILIKMSEDFKIMKKFKFSAIKTLLLKNLSKIKQFF